MPVVCRNRHLFATRAKPGSTISCPQCRRDTGERVAVWVPAASATGTFVSRYGHVRYTPNTGLGKLHGGQPCEGCGEASTGLDHCHVHGWIRGTLCTRCNGEMRAIDGREAGDHAQMLLDYWLNCPDCASAGPWSPGDPPAERPYRGSKVSVYLNDELTALVRASPFTMSELVRRGLDAIENVPAPARQLDVETVRRVIREELAGRLVADVRSQASYEPPGYSSEPFEDSA